MSFNSKTVVELKAMLGELGLAKTGKKADLIARLEFHKNNTFSKKADYNVGQKLVMYENDGTPIIYNVIEVQAHHVVVLDQENTKHRMPHKYPFLSYQSLYESDGTPKKNEEEESPKKNEQPLQITQKKRTARGKTARGKVVNVARHSSPKKEATPPSPKKEVVAPKKKEVPPPKIAKTIQVKLAFRLETFADLSGILANCVKQEICIAGFTCKQAEINGHSIPDVDVSDFLLRAFVKEGETASVVMLETIRKLIKAFNDTPDSHVGLESLNFADLYSGERNDAMSIFVQRKFLSVSDANKITTILDNLITTL